MLSVLIPTYNYDCLELIQQVHAQCIRSGIEFEIRVYDDCSTQLDKQRINATGQDLNHVVYKELSENVGFCKIRNRLAEDAIFDHLLFLDSDCKIIKSNFISDYLEKLDSTTVFCGGMKYQVEKPKHELLLKWVHGKEREEHSPQQRNKNPYRTIWAGNFLIPKSIYLQTKFDENSIQYGYNDTMFGYKLKVNDTPVIHIDNPCYHDGLMPTEKFINRSLEAVENLLFFENQVYIQPDFTKFIKVLSIYDLLQKTKISKWFLKYYIKNKAKWISNLKSNHPKLRNLDKLKLGKLIELKSEKVSK